MADLKITDRRSGAIGSLGNSTSDGNSSTSEITRAYVRSLEGGPRDSPDLRELGLPGTKINVGQIFEEDNIALRGDKGLKAWRQMGYDPTVAMVLKTVLLPCQATRWRMQPPSDDPTDVAMADFAHYNFWEFGSMSMDDLIRQGLGGRNQYGFSLHEIIWKVEDENGAYPGHAMIDRFAYRAQVSRYRWNIEEVDRADGSKTRELVSVTQHPYPSLQYLDIPRDKLLLLVREQTGENYDGVSLLRAAWKPWMIRDKLYAIQTIGLERSYMGIPYGTLPVNYTASMQSVMQSIVENLRTRENAGFTTREDMPIGILNNKVEGRAMQDAIEFMTHQIPLSTLAQFTLLGSREVGSFALSSDQSDLFLMVLNADCNYFAETLNLHPIIPQLIDYNFPNVPKNRMPRMVHGNVGERNLERMGRTLAGLLQWGGITPDDAMEDALREQLGLPARDAAVTPDYLKSLVELITPESGQLPGANTDDERVLPGGKIYEAEGKPPTLIGGPPGAPTPPSQTSPGALAMSEYRRAQAVAPWRRPDLKGGRLDETSRMDALRLETFMEFSEAMKPPGAPMKPSERAWSERKPYELSEKVVTRPEQIAAQHAASLQNFLKVRKQARKPSAIPAPSSGSPVPF